MRSKTPATTKSRSALAELRDELAQQRASTQAHRRLLDHLAQRVTEQERKTRDALEIVAIIHHRMDGAEKEAGKLRSRLRELVPDVKDELVTPEESATFFATLRCQLRHTDLLNEALESLRTQRRR